MFARIIINVGIAPRIKRQLGRVKIRSVPVLRVARRCDQILQAARIKPVVHFILAERGFEPRMPASGTDLQDAVEWRPQVGLLEIGQVDKKAGIELIGVVGQSDVAVAVMNDELDPLSLDECVGAGASAVIETRSRMTDLIAVLKRLTADEVIVDSELTQLATDHRNRANASRLAPFAMLTAREKSVLAELMNGHRAEAIAKNSRVSISTVRSQIKAILQKLGVNCQLAAVAMAREAGWEKELADP